MSEYVPYLKKLYYSEVLPALMSKFGYKNPLQAPKPIKVVVNMGVGEGVSEPSQVEAAAEELAWITGQRPQVRRARKNIAGFKLRKGMPIGVRVTLRGNRMWDFLYKLMYIALPRVRDFKGVSPNSFDGRGNYNLGLSEQLVFPELDFDKIKAVRGMDIAIVTSARTDEEAYQLLKLLGMPFKEVE